jgi:hypothetical protein
MNCLIKNIPNNISVASGNSGIGFPFSITELTCLLAPEYYLIAEQSTPGNEIFVFTQHPRFIELLESDAP